MAIGDTLNPTLTQGVVLPGAELAQAGTSATQTFDGTQNPATTLEGFAAATLSPMIEPSALEPLVALTQSPPTTPVDRFTPAVGFLPQQVEHRVGVTTRMPAIFSFSNISTNSLPAAIEAIIQYHMDKPTFVEETTKLFGEVVTDADSATTELSETMLRTINLAEEIHMQSFDAVAEGKTFPVEDPEDPRAMLESYKKASEFLLALHKLCLAKELTPELLAVPLYASGLRTAAGEIYDKLIDPSSGIKLSEKMPPWLKAYAEGSPLFYWEKQSQYFSFMTEKMPNPFQLSRLVETTNFEMMRRTLERMQNWPTKDIVKTFWRHIKPSLFDHAAGRFYCSLFKHYELIDSPIDTHVAQKFANKFFNPAGIQKKEVQAKIVFELFRLASMHVADLELKVRMLDISIYELRLMHKLAYTDIFDDLIIGVRFANANGRNLKQAVARAIEIAIANMKAVQEAAPKIIVAQPKRTPEKQLSMHAIPVGKPAAPTAPVQTFLTDNTAAEMLGSIEQVGKSPAAQNYWMPETNPTAGTRVGSNMPPDPLPRPTQARSKTITEVLRLPPIPWRQEDFAALTQFGIAYEITNNGMGVTFTRNGQAPDTRFMSIRNQDGSLDSARRSLVDLLEQKLFYDEPFQVTIAANGMRGVKITNFAIDTRTPIPATSTSAPVQTTPTIAATPEKTSLPDSAAWRAEEIAAIQAMGVKTELLREGKELRVTHGKNSNLKKERDSRLIPIHNKDVQLKSFIEWSRKLYPNFVITVLPAGDGKVKMTLHQTF